MEELKIKLAKEPRRQLSMSGWRMVTMCQLEARLASENRQRAAVSAQAALIQVYQSLAHNQLVNVGTLERKDDSTNHYQHERLRLESFDIEFYRTSANTFDAAYAQIDEVLDSCGLDSMDERCDTFTHEQNHETDRSYFQYIDKQKFLSGFEQACSTLTRTISLHQPETNRSTTGWKTLATP